MLLAMVRTGVASAHLYHDPWGCRLVGLVTVFWLLGLLIFICGVVWVEVVVICSY